MQSLKHPVVTSILLGWHLLLAALGHGLHYVTGGDVSDGGRCVSVAVPGCGCAGAAGTAGSRCMPMPTFRRGDRPAEQPAAGQPARRPHDAHHCPICQYLAQHKSSTSGDATASWAEPIAALAEPAVLVARASCACPYASRAPPSA